MKIKMQYFSHTNPIDPRTSILNNVLRDHLLQTIFFLQEFYMKNVILVMPSVVTRQNFNTAPQKTVSHFPFLLFCSLSVCVCTGICILYQILSSTSAQLTFFLYFTPYWIANPTTVSDTQQMLSKHFWKARKKMKEPAYKTRPHYYSESMIIMKSGIWRNLLILNNNFRVWLAVVIWPEAKITKVDEFFNCLVTDKATLPVSLLVWTGHKQTIRSVNSFPTSREKNNFSCKLTARELGTQSSVTPGGW